jgi:hypothetical protein
MVSGAVLTWVCLVTHCASEVRAAFARQTAPPRATGKALGPHWCVRAKPCSPAQWEGALVV